jgi:glycosyltransferase involved in cell wall biosynthesis
MAFVGDRRLKPYLYPLFLIFMILSIIIPAFNEETSITALLKRVVAAPLPTGVQKEIIIVDDCSADLTGERAQVFANEHPDSTIRYVRHTKNQGKGAALHTGIGLARGNWLIIQDADLEYDPNEYERLLKPLMDNRADAVYGSRFVGNEAHRVLYFWHSVGNRFLTLVSNVFTNLNLTDMESCYKIFRTDIIQQLPLTEKRFGFEPEVTAKLARVPGIRIYEVGISYYGRTYAEGKKIGWRDGFRALYAIIRYNVFAGETVLADAQPFSEIEAVQPT